MALIPCPGNDTPETNTWLNLQKIGCAVIWNDLQIPCQLVPFQTRTQPTRTQLPVRMLKNESKSQCVQTYIMGLTI